MNQKMIFAWLIVGVLVYAVSSLDIKLGTSALAVNPVAQMMPKTPEGCAKLGC